jgi:hypothetical protein
MIWRFPETRRLQLARMLALAVLPLAGAVAGALLDERHHLGFTNWRSACRAVGFSFRSVMFFSFELLPTAIVGLLAGGLALQAIGVVMRHRGHADLCLAAHAGCALTMPVGLALCALALPLPVMLVTDALLAFAAAWILSGFSTRFPAGPAGLHP